MTSIRFYLVAVILACITLVNFISALHGYFSSMAMAGQLFDQQLMDMSGLIQHHPVNQTLSLDIHSGAAQFIAYQIWDVQSEKLQTRSTNAPDTTIAPFKTGFHDRNFNGYRWRVYCVLNEARQGWIMLAQRADIRYQLAEKMILESILPTILALPMIALIIWIIVNIGLKPLRALSQRLQNKEADDLDPIDLPNQPKEINPLLNSINDLLKRLESSFSREKRFAADAAHELRTPISVLKIHIFNLMNEKPDHSEQFQPLQTGINRLSHLVEQILTLYRTTPDQYMAKFEILNLFELAQNCLADQYQQFDDKQQNLELQGYPVYLTGDRFALETLLNNLLSNACKYSPKQSQIRVHIFAEKNTVYLQVEDSGPGIPAEKYERVFERFYRLDGDQHKSGTLGCGLGLAIVNHIAELHKALIRLSHSSFESGLKVSVEFKTSQSRTQHLNEFYPPGERM